MSSATDLEGNFFWSVGNSPSVEITRPASVGEPRNRTDSKLKRIVNKSEIFTVKLYLVFKEKLGSQKIKVVKH